MDFSNLTLNKLIGAKMDYTTARQDQLAHNIQEIDVPGAVGHDITPPDFEHLASLAGKRLAMTQTQSGHIPPGGGKSGTYRADKVKTSYAVTPMKNNIVLEEQSMLMAKNQMEFQVASNLYSKMNKLFKTALGKS